MISKGRLYSLLLISCAIGYIWVYFILTNVSVRGNQVCLIKRITNISCPSCGTTRSIVSIIKGDFTSSMINPIGYIVLMIMVVSPLLIIYDTLFKKNHLFDIYNKIEILLKKPKYYQILIFIAILNWAWNIIKGN